MIRNYQAMISARITVGFCILAVCILLGITSKTFGQSCNVSAGGNQSMCANDVPIPLYGSSLSSNPIFSWSSNGDGTFDDSSNPTTFYSPGPNDIENQAVQITLSVTCYEGTSSDQMTLNIIPNPNPVITGGPVLCAGSTIDAGAGYDDYYWQWNGDQNFSGGYGTDETQVVPGSDTYYLTVELNGCVGYSSAYILAEGGTYDFIASGSSFCYNSIIDLSLSASNPDDMYQILEDGNPYGSPYPGDPDGGALDFGNQYLDPGTYTVSSVYCNNLMNGSYTIVAGPDAELTPNGATTICSGQGHVVLQATPTGNNYTYSWDTPDNYSSNSSSFNADQTGYYIVYITDQTTGCMSSALQAFVVNNSPTPTISASGATTFCSGGSVTLDAGSYAYYHWNTSASTHAITATTSRTYLVTITDGNGCTGIASKVVTVNTSPTVRISPSGTTTLCPGFSVTLDAGTYPSYIWSTSATTESITTSSAGTYSVTVTSGNGCTGVSSVPVTTVTFPNPVITGATSGCSGSTITLGTTVSYQTYTWSTGATTASIGVTTSGTYFVIVANGTCSTSTTTNVTFLTSPAPAITTTGLSTYCSGTGNVTLNAGNSYSSYHWNTNASSQSIAVTQGNPGTYTVTVSSSNGCTGSTSSVVTSSCNAPSFAAAPTINITATTAMANWILPTCYYGLTIRISRHNLNTWSNYTISTNTHYTFSQLLHNTAYDWQIRTNCNAALTIVSDWSAVQTFTTSARLGDGESEESIVSFNAYPNPAKGLLNIAFNSDKEEAYNVQLIDVTGRVISAVKGNSVVGENQYQLNLSEVSQGVYMVILSNENSIVQKKIMVN